MKNTIYNCRHKSAEEIIAFIIELYPSLVERKNRKHIYIGVTGDIATRARAHNISTEEIIFCARTASRRVAAKVERIAHSLGFFIGNVSWGGNGTNSRSIYTYAYVIDSHTRE